MRVKPIDLLAVAGVLLIVNVVTFALRLTVNTCAAERSRVSVPADIAGALVVSL
jgi:hypothetical protein